MGQVRRSTIEIIWETLNATQTDIQVQGKTFVSRGDLGSVSSDSENVKWWRYKTWCLKNQSLGDISKLLSVGV